MNSLELQKTQQEEKLVRSFINQAEDAISNRISTNDNDVVKFDLKNGIVYVNSKSIVGFVYNKILYHCDKASFHNLIEMRNKHSNIEEKFLKRLNFFKKFQSIFGNSFIQSL